MLAEPKNKPNAWNWVRCQDVIDVRDGTHDTPAYISEGIPLITSKNLTKGYIDFSDAMLISRSDHEQIKKRSGVDKGDIIMPMIGTIGSPVLVDTDDEFSIKNVALFKFSKSKVLSKFFYYLLQSEVVIKQFEKDARGITQKFVSLDTLRNLQIPLPPLEQQRHIATILSRADRLRRLRKHALEISDSYLQGVFLEVFGDPSTNSKKWYQTIVEEIVKSSQYGTSEKSNLEGRGYPILGMSNLTYSGKLDLSSFSYVDISVKDFEELKLEPGDIIFNRTNSTELVGKTAHWNINMSAVLASYLVKLKLDDTVLPDFFTALLNMPHYKMLFQKRCKKAVGQSNVSPTLLKEFPMIVPPLELQHHFAHIVRKHERLRSQQQEALRQAEHLYQTLLHQAFTGGLT